MTKPDDKLEPCPFCGGEASMSEDDDHLGGVYVMVRCKECHSEGPAVRVNDRTARPTPEESAAEGWNTRSPTDFAREDMREMTKPDDDLSQKCIHIPDSLEAALEVIQVSGVDYTARDIAALAVKTLRPWLRHAADCLAQRDLHMSENLCVCGLKNAANIGHDQYSQNIGDNAFSGAPESSVKANAAPLDAADYIEQLEREVARLRAENQRLRNIHGEEGLYDPDLNQGKSVNAFETVARDALNREPPEPQEQPE